MHQNSCFCGGITQVLLKNWGGGGGVTLLFKLTCYIKFDNKIYVTKDAEKNVCMLSTILPFHY